MSIRRVRRRNCRSADNPVYFIPYIEYNTLLLASYSFTSLFSNISRLPYLIGFSMH